MDSPTMTDIDPNTHWQRDAIQRAIRRYQVFEPALEGCGSKRLKLAGMGVDSFNVECLVYMFF